jgi:hypothetical protein
MNPKLIMAAVAIFIFGTLLSCLCSGIWLGGTDTVTALASFNTMSVQSGGVWNAPKTLSTYWDALITVLSWNYPFLSSPWALMIKIPLWIVSVGVVWGVIQLFVSIIQSLVGMVRNFLPGG